MAVTAVHARQSPEQIARRSALALRMLELGAWVFPLAHDSKVPFVPKAQGGGGFKDARPDVEMARTFLSNPGQLNYGVVFPEGSDVFVLDLDGGDGHTTWKEDWQRQYDLYGPPGLSYTVKTPSDGHHAYYRWRADLYGPMPPSDEMLGWTVRKPWKGYLVGPGSVVGGREYKPMGADLIADFPEAWARAAAAERHGPAPSTERDTLTIKGPAQVTRGHRHKYLRDQARYLVGIGLSGEALFTAVSDLNSKMSEPKTADEVRRAIGEAESKFEPDELDEETGARVQPEEDGLDLLPLGAAGAFPESPAAAAFAGLLGECVHDLAGGTDASTVGLLGSLIALCGALVPGQAYFHRLQTSSPFVALVGESSTGRKGTAMMRAADAMSDAIGAVYVNRAILDGLASGEGLVTALHYKQTTYANEQTVGLVFEEEYATLLAARSREGSTLDPKMRAAFDGGPLSNRRSGEVKSVLPPYWLPALIAITPDELRARIETGAFLSGSANRWLYLPVRRREVVPSNAPPVLPEPLRDALVAARRTALGTTGALEVEPAVVTLLTEYADYLPTTAQGLAHELSRRLGVIAFRVGLIHALVERSSTVTTEHVHRAIALTEYGRASIPWVFGDMLGNKDADLLLRHLLAKGRLSKNAITRGIIRDPLRQQAAIDELLRWGHADLVTVRGTGGRARRELVPHTGSRSGWTFVHVSLSASISDPMKPVDEMDETSQTAWTEGGRNPVDAVGRKLDEMDETATVENLPAVLSHTCRDYTAHQHTGHQRTPDGAWSCSICYPEDFA